MHSWYTSTSTYERWLNKIPLGKIQSKIKVLSNREDEILPGSCLGK